MSEASHINALPHGVLHEIFRPELGPKDLAAVSATCSLWHRLNKDAAANQTWKEFYMMKWMVGAQEQEVPVSWQQMYGMKMRRIASWTGKYAQDNYYGHSSGIRCLKLLPSHGLMATGSLDKTVRLWSLSSGLPMSASTALRGTVRAIALDSQALAAGGGDNHIRVWESNTTTTSNTSNTTTTTSSGAVPFDLKAPCTLLKGHIGPVSCLSMTEDLLFSASWDYSVRAWARSDWGCRSVLKFPEWVWCLAVRGANLFISTGPEVLVHDLVTGKITRKFQHLHDGDVTCVEGTQDGRVLFSGAADGLVMQHDLRMRDPSRLLWHHTSAVAALAFEDPWLSSCSSDGTVMLLNHESPPRAGGGSVGQLGPYCRQLSGPGGPVHCVDLADQWLACGSDCEVVRTWDFTKAAVASERAEAARLSRRESKRERRSARRRLAETQPKKLLSEASGSASSSASPMQSPTTAPCFPQRLAGGGGGARGKQPTPHSAPRGAPGQVWQVARPRSAHQPASSSAVSDKRPLHR